MKKDFRKNYFESVVSLGQRDKELHIKNILDRERLANFQVKTELLDYDYSKQRITKKALIELLKIPEEINLSGSIKKIFSGGDLNLTEDRKVSHILHRGSHEGVKTRDLDKISESTNQLMGFIKKMQLNREHPIKKVISIGIGGSRLGTQLLSEAFSDIDSLIKVHYCSSYDLIELDNIISVCKPLNTLIIISSKSFSTPEVLDNAKKAISWLKSSGSKDPLNNLIGISSNKQRMIDYGIKESHQFNILDSIGGRFSIWSSFSLPAIIDIGEKNFAEFKEGASLADQHFLQTKWKKNIPVLMALLNLWNMNALGITNLGIFTYDYRARSVPKYLSQMMMESNGKSFTPENEKTPFKTCPLVWGGYGPDSQHSVFQWLLQGSYYSACDFIGIKTNGSDKSNSYQMLLAQVAALSVGEKDKEDNFKSIEGNNPISLLKLKEFSPKSLGFLLACYEHKVFVESCIYGINAFDQWGVQLGKKLTLKSKIEKNFMKDLFDNEFLS